MATLRATNQESEDAKKKRLRQLEQKLEAKVRVYDEDMTRLTDEHDTLYKLHTEESERLQEVTAKLEAYIQERIDFEENVLKPRQQAEAARKRREAAALLIQRTYRMYAVNNSKSKKGKKGKKGGKKK